ncbi:riboflavin biosynthesis protein PYRR, chloroplastic isoform X4 [Helianthus annuus]|uniref:riboflavin biosynthesis protein PYRR, chloroplastic isoform X4 n=1 Tax=Helianthus annuus TaxID=4232 RepID=UPI000B901F9F|nr:riboflavin biosynthesis protein PYRR, chloroplastic isoform X4 [Helianthus annuus]
MTTAMWFTPSFTRHPTSIINCTYNHHHALDASYVKRAADLSDKSACFTSPHPNFGCVIATARNVVGEGYLYAQGTKPAEVQAVEAAGEYCRGATAYVNMEPGDCHGDFTAVSAFIKAGITRVVVGIRHPLQHLRGKAIQTLRTQGLQVDVLGEDIPSISIQDALKSCLVVNAPLLYRSACRVPFSVLKYAMTLDGKIAATSGHSTWISSTKSRSHVFELRGRSDAVIVGGSTVRKDNPRLTPRHGSGGHLPMRIVMSQTLDLPEVANLWDVREAPTIVATQRGARRSFQKFLASKGVEVVEFDSLNPKDVMDYLYDLGYLSILWECGGALSASAISAGVIHKVHAFVAPKIIGGKNAPSPVGELGMVEMTQALELIDVSYEQAQKFVGSCNPNARNYIEVIRSAKSPEEAAQMGRRTQREHPDMVRADWESMKREVMYKALKCKFSIYPHLNSMLLSTSGSILVEASPHDLFWGRGRDGEGLNYLGRLLMKLRSEFLGDDDTHKLEILQGIENFNNINI